MQCHTQAGKIPTNLKVKIDFTLPKLSAMKIVTSNCHLYDSTKFTYDMILDIYLLTASGLNLILSKYVIKSNDGPFKGSMAPTVDLGTCEFKYLDTG